MPGKQGYVTYSPSCTWAGFDETRVKMVLMAEDEKELRKQQTQAKHNTAMATVPAVSPRAPAVSAATPTETSKDELLQLIQIS